MVIKLAIKCARYKLLRSNQEIADDPKSSVCKNLSGQHKKIPELYSHEHQI